jgi:maltoporin
MNISFRMWCIAAAAAALAPGLAAAQSLETAGSYFRAGTGVAHAQHRGRACYALAGDGMRYRLGNECDVYGEFNVRGKYTSGAQQYSLTVMPTLYNSTTALGDSATRTAQFYGDAKGFGFAPQTVLWLGRRYYRRDDVHIVDTQYIDMSGDGGGAHDIPLGGAAKLALAYFHTDEGATLAPSVTRPGSRINVELYDMPANPGGQLRLIGTATHGDFGGGTNGFGFIAQHKQSKFLVESGTNKVWLQYAQGSANLKGNFGRLDAGSDVKRWRLVESYDFQNGRLGGQGHAMVQADRDPLSGRTDSSSFGGRLSYGFTEHFKLVGELGYSRKRPQATPEQRLAKFTIAPTFSPNPTFWSRPELRFYVTHARWNAAANAAAGTGGVTGLGDGRTTGTSYGVQLETWW